MQGVVIKSGNQNFSSTGVEAASLCSYTNMETTLIIGSETITLPVQVSTQIGELRECLAAQLGFIDASTIDFVVKQGCSYRKMLESDQVLTRMHVKGIKSFKPPRHQYPHPYGIIGCGYTGIKTALFLEGYGAKNYVMFDRYDRVGGHTWLEMANKTTKLQTEFPTYHVWYGKEWSLPGIEKCGGAPITHEIWPNRDKLLEHFQRCVDDYGLAVNMHLQTNCETMDMFGKVTDKDRSYQLTCVPVHYERKDVQGGGSLAHQEGGRVEMHRSDGTRIKDREPFQSRVSMIAMWPGALCFPRPVVYKGEQLFGGLIDYAVEMRCDYTQVTNQEVCIVGHGAFTMENIRTCLEYGSKHITVLCRKMNLTCPRPVSWFVNQADPPIAAAQLLDMLQVSYKLFNFDPWTMHSVHANQARTHATIIQKSRFGIGDVYFLCQHYQLMQIVIGVVKRCTFQTLHLEDGGKVECNVVLKCTGCLGDWKVDRLLKIKEMRGPFVNGDNRRVTCGEADGINAAQFGGTTGGPGMYGLIKSLIHWWDVPNDWNRLLDMGILDQLPVHKAGEPDPEFPAYFFTASHAQASGLILSSSSPLLQQKEAGDGQYKNYIQLTCIPPERLINEAKADWERYEVMFRERGQVSKDEPFCPYPYTLEYIYQQFEVHRQYVVKRYT